MTAEKLRKFGEDFDQSTVALEKKNRFVGRIFSSARKCDPFDMDMEIIGNTLPAHCV